MLVYISVSAHFLKLFPRKPLKSDFGKKKIVRSFFSEKVHPCALCKMKGLMNKRINEVYNSIELQYILHNGIYPVLEMCIVFGFISVFKKKFPEKYLEFYLKCPTSKRKSAKI